MVSEQTVVTRKTTLRLPETLLRDIRILAATEYATLTDVIIRALEREVEKGGLAKK